MTQMKKTDKFDAFYSNKNRRMKKLLVKDNDEEEEATGATNQGSTWW